MFRILTIPWPAQEYVSEVKYRFALLFALFLRLPTAVTVSLDGPEFDAVLNRNAGFAQRPQRQSFNRHIIFQPLRGEKIGYRLDADRQPRHSIFIQHHVGKKSRRVPPCRVGLAANEPGLLQPRLQANIDWQSEMVDPVDEPRAGLVAQSIGESDKVSAAIYKSGKHSCTSPAATGWGCH